MDTYNYAHGLCTPNIGATTASAGEILIVYMENVNIKLRSASGALIDLSIHSSSNY